MNKDKFIKQCLYYEGTKEGTPIHGQIVKIYNSIKPLPQKYTLKTSDSWCAAFLSAMAWKTSGGDPGAFPYECSCNRMIERAKAAKIWIEDESVAPQVGWLVLYDWQDSGKGDNKGGADHVGVVIKVTNKTIVVLEGNNNDAVRRRTISQNAKYLRGYIAPKYDKVSNNKKDSTDAIAKQVIKGLWGTGNTRVELLTKAGYDAKAIQKRVNELLL